MKSRKIGTLCLCATMLIMLFTLVGGSLLLMSGTAHAQAWKFDAVLDLRSCGVMYTAGYRFDKHGNTIVEATTLGMVDATSQMAASYGKQSLDDMLDYMEATAAAGEDGAFRKRCYGRLVAADLQ